MADGVQMVCMELLDQPAIKLQTKTWPKPTSEPSANTFPGN